MAKAGGIVALIAGIFGVIAAGFTLSVGGIGRAVNAENAQSVVLLGWGELLFSFLVIVLGAMAMRQPTELLGWGLILCSLLGALLCGTFVAVFMLLSLVGGMLVFNGKKASASAASRRRETKLLGWGLILFGLMGALLAPSLVALFIMLSLVGAVLLLNGEWPSTASASRPAPAPSLAPSSSMGQKVAELRRLSELRADGKITAEEFVRLKSDFLQGGGATDTSDARASEAGDESPLLLKTPLKQPVQMNFADIPKLEKMNADGLLSDEEAARLIGGIVSRHHHSLSIDDLPVLGKLYANGSLTEEQFSSAKSAIIASSS